MHARGAHDTHTHASGSCCRNWLTTSRPRALYRERGLSSESKRKLATSLNTVLTEQASAPELHQSSWVYQTMHNPQSYLTESDWNFIQSGDNRMDAKVGCVVSRTRVIRTQPGTHP